MIPVRLQLKNFMSYGERVPPLDLTGVRMACLSGDNGNGKTALLDAMTWALFGETRATAEDDVVRLGATDCSILFDFLVGDAMYRVRKARGKRGGAIWELQIWQGDGSLRGLSGTNARETKAKIEQLLRMDYKTFLASGYLAQGRADEFARATVTERKKVLADILDLGRYERLEQLAKERRAEADGRATDAERELRGIDAELEREDYYHAEREKAQARLADATVVVDETRAEYEARAAQMQVLEVREEKAQEYEARIPDIETEIRQGERSLQGLEKRVADANVVYARQAEIEGNYARWKSLTESIKPLESQYDAVLALQGEAQTLEREIQNELNTLDRERYRLDCEVQQLTQESAAIGEYDKEIDRLDLQIAPLASCDTRRQEAEAKRAECDDKLLNLKAEASSLRAQDGSLARREAALAEGAGGLCDYCGQALSPEKRAQALAQTQAERAELLRQQTTITQEGREIKRQSEQWRGESEAAQRDGRTLSGLEAKRATAAQERIRIVERTRTQPDIQKRLTGLETKITNREYAPAAQERLMKIAAQLEKSERVRQQLTDARTQLLTYGNAERDLLTLQTATETLATEPERIAELYTGIEKRTAQITKAHDAIARIRAVTAALPTLRREQADTAARLNTAEETARVAQREIGNFDARLAHCKELRGERAKRQEEYRVATIERDQFKELMAAFGKKGVQALIIDNTLPEIQNEANNLLGRMSDGGMQLQLKSQREARTKTAGGGTGAIETLDIIISDDMGTRPYEMYSGGEAFRINFALRVALSKILAKRAGAPLQTLILDEGFGTQDGRGREAILDALNSIQEDFALILVITHIEELKETFPVRIEVMKGAGGSTFTVSSS